MSDTPCTENDGEKPPDIVAENSLHVAAMGQQDQLGSSGSFIVQKMLNSEGGLQTEGVKEINMIDESAGVNVDRSGDTRGEGEKVAPEEGVPLQRETNPSGSEGSGGGTDGNVVATNVLNGRDNDNVEVENAGKENEAVGNMGEIVNEQETGGPVRLTRKQKRKLDKKRRRRLAALAREQEEREIAEAVTEEELARQEAQAQREKETRDAQEQEWLRREEVLEAKSEIRRKMLEQEEKRRVEAKARLEAKREAQKATIEKELQRITEEKRRRRESLAGKTPAGEGNDTPWNPVPAGSVPLSKDECGFYQKTGVCKFGNRCSRVHTEPTSSPTLVFPGMYVYGGRVVDDDNQDDLLDYDEDEAYASFRSFYDEVLPEFQRFGKVVQFKVCYNNAPHLHGNVYVQYLSSHDALSALHSMNGRWFDGRQIFGSLCTVIRWKPAICGLAAFKKCPRGSDCNFLHVFRNPGGAFSWADRDEDGDREKGFNRTPRDPSWSERGRGNEREWDRGKRYTDSWDVEEEREWRSQRSERRSSRGGDGWDEREGRRDERGSRSERRESERRDRDGERTQRRRDGEETPRERRGSREGRERETERGDRKRSKDEREEGGSRKRRRSSSVEIDGADDKTRSRSKSRSSRKGEKDERDKGRRDDERKRDGSRERHLRHKSKRRSRSRSPRKKEKEKKRDKNRKREKTDRNDAGSEAVNIVTNANGEDVK